MKMAFSFLCCLICFSSLAQSDKDVLVRVQKEAQVMSDAFHKPDYDTYMDHIHPRVIENIGGRDKMKAFLHEGLNSEIGFVKTDVSQARKLIKQGANWQCAMKQAQVIQVGKKQYKVQGWLIGISYDAGVSWRFISVSNQTLKTLQKGFPELSNKLKVKPQKEPRLIIQDI